MKMSNNISVVNNNTYYIYVVMLLCLSGLWSCVSLNSHQTGKTLGKGNYNFSGNVLAGPSPLLSSDVFKNAYHFEVGGMYGTEDNIDIGVKVNSSLFFTMMGKYQWLGDKQSAIASSIGLDIGVAPLYVITGITTYSGSLAFYNSYHPSEHFAIVFSPRFIHYSTAVWTHGNDDHNHYPLYGYSTGIIVGKKHQFSFEVSQFTTIEDTYSFALPPIIGFGYIWNIGK